jgi:hypothetical protein
VPSGQVVSNGQVSLGPQPSPQVMQLAYLFQAMQNAAQQAHAMQQAYAAQQKEAEAVLAAQHKQQLGTLLFAKIAPKLDAMKETAAYSDEEQEAVAWPENITTGKIVGMFLEGMDAAELQELLDDDVACEERFNEAIGILHDHWETVLKAQGVKGHEWICGRWVPIGTDPIEAPSRWQEDRDARIAAGH